MLRYGAPMFDRSGTRNSGLIVWWLGLALLLCGSGCMVAKPKPKVASEVQPSLAVTTEQMRLRMRSLINPFCGQIEHEADAIMASSTDLRVKRAALQWKIDAVPAMRQALIRPNPFGAVFDTLALLNQMADYFETGEGRQELGPASAQAVATCRDMEEQLYKV